MAKDHFILPENQVYLSGHSLGPISLLSQARCSAALHQWETHLVNGWESEWMALPNQVAAKIADLVRTSSSCIAVGDSTSVNLYKALIAAQKINSQRTVILTTQDNFPTDLYVAEGVARFNPEITVKKVCLDHLEQALNEEISVLVVSHVQYRDAHILDIEHLTKLSHQFGILIVVDVCHSVGILPLNLDASEIDFAVGCTYKYLKGGPGSPAFIYVNQRHHQPMVNPIAGWMGHSEPFAFSENYTPKNDVKQFMSGTPTILSLAALDGSLDLFADIDMQDLFNKAQQHTAFLHSSLNDIGIISLNRQSHIRGGHVAFIHANAEVMCSLLNAAGFIVDYRPPNLIRICVDPMYISLDDLQHFLNYLMNTARKIK